MKTYIILHEPMKVMDTEARVPCVTLREGIETTEQQHAEIRNQYESRAGKYGMTNPSLDLCWWLEDEIVDGLMSR